MENTKIVRFDIYCKTCKYKDADETKQPCCDCLEQPINGGTDCPALWEEKK